MTIDLWNSLREEYLYIKNKDLQRRDDIKSILTEYSRIAMEEYSGIVSYHFENNYIPDPSEVDFIFPEDWCKDEEYIALGMVPGKYGYLCIDFRKVLKL